MLELSPAEWVVIDCYAEPAALDALRPAPGARVLRVAPDEAMVLAEGDRDALLQESTGALGADSIVLDASDGWIAWALLGAVREAFSRLSALELPDEGFVQGDVARVPVKVLVAGDRLDLLVPAMWGEHLRRQILSRCARLGVQEVEIR